MSAARVVTDVGYNPGDVDDVAFSTAAERVSLHPGAGWGRPDEPSRAAGADRRAAERRED